MPNIHKGHRSRVKREFLENGLEHFPDHKVLEMLLFYTVPQRDTNTLGHLLLDRFGSLSGVLDAPRDMLLQVPGIGEESATLIKFATGLMRAYLNDCTSHEGVISDAAAAREYMRHKFLGERSECVYMACLGGGGKVIFCDRIAEGAPETVGVVPADVVKTALRAGAAKVVLAHNHPGGICLPSARDTRTTGVLYDALRRVDVDLFDHIIVAADEAYSMLENGMLPLPPLAHR